MASRATPRIGSIGTASISKAQFLNANNLVIPVITARFKRPLVALVRKVFVEFLSVILPKIETISTFGDLALLNLGSILKPLWMLPSRNIYTFQLLHVLLQV